MRDVADIVGRILISFIFFFEGFDSIFHFQSTKSTMVDYGITWQPGIILGVIIFLLMLGATLVLIGYGAKLGACLLLLYWIPFTFIVYSWWNDPVEIQRLHSLYFSRNMAIAGGLLLLVANGAGKYSIKRLLYVMRLPK